AATLAAACGELGDDCADTATCDTTTGGAGDGGTAANGGAPNGGGGAGASSAGGSPTTGGSGGTGGAPDCMTHADCTDPANAQCEGVAGPPACDAGTCVECILGDGDACTGGQTCDLLAKECGDVGPESVQNCGACTNALQCEADHRCIAMDFEGAPHGHY